MCSKSGEGTVGSLEGVISADEGTVGSTGDVQESLILTKEGLNQVNEGTNPSTNPGQGGISEDDKPTKEVSKPISKKPKKKTKNLFSHKEKRTRGLYTGKLQKHSIFFMGLYGVLLGCFGYLCVVYRNFFTMVYSNGVAFKNSLKLGLAKPVQGVGTDGTAILKDSSVVRYSEIVPLPRGKGTWYYEGDNGKLLTSLDWATIWHMSWYVWVGGVLVITILTAKGWVLRHNEVQGKGYTRLKENKYERRVRVAVILLATLTVILSFISVI